MAELDISDPQSTRILVVDDDPEIAAMLREYLELHGFEVQTAHDGRQLDQRIQALQPDLLLLDLMLPGEDGLSIARRVGSSVPVLMMSARAEDADRIAGLELGAEDFVAKPFNLRELLARIRVILRRRTLPSPSSEHSDSIKTFGAYRLDIARRTLQRDGQPIALSTAEFALLRVFAECPRQVLSRDELLDKARTLNEHLPFDRSIDTRVARLRRKIEDDPTQPRYLKTVRGMGYLFDPDADTP